MHWEVAYPTKPGRSVLTNGTAADRHSALAEVIEAGRDFAARDTVTSETPFYVRVGSETGWVKGFGDPAVTDAQLSERIVDTIVNENQRAQTVTEAATPVGATRYSTQAGSVAEQWARIAAWLNSHHAPVTIAGATKSQIAEAAESTGTTWPPELIEFYDQINGFPSEEWVRLLPDHSLFSVEQAVDHRATMIEVYAETDAIHGYTPPVGTTAGTRVRTFLPEFIPFAGLDGYLLFVDTRPGDLHGCVTEFDKTSADGAGPRWVSLSAMLTDLAESLETGSTFDKDWKPTVVDDQLNWQ